MKKEDLKTSVFIVTLKEIQHYAMMSNNVHQAKQNDKTISYSDVLLGGL